MENTNCFNFGGQNSMLEDTSGRNMTANPYDENSTYTKGSICIQNNKLYESNQNIDVAEQFTESHWTETTLGDIVSKNKSDISVLTEKSKYLGVDKTNVKISKTGTTQKICSLENLPAGLYSVFATSERLTSTVSNGSSWLMVGVNDNVPGSGHSDGITIPSNVPYATVNYSRYFNVPEDGGSINAYIKAADISANFNVILQAVRIA